VSCWCVEPGKPSNSAAVQRAGISRVVRRRQDDRAVRARRHDLHASGRVRARGVHSVRRGVLSDTGRDAVIAMLGPGDFFGEGSLAGQPLRMGSATAAARSTILLIAKAQMVRLLHKQHAMSDRFIAHMLARNIRVEQDLVDQLFNSSEKRLARALLLLARYGKQDRPIRAAPKVSQETLAEMIGTTRSRVNFFLNKFKKLGFIEYDGQHPLKVNGSLLSVILHERA
jgi:CRP/FNR family transcriptional regulator, cyclic AMP receptor protein